MPADIRDYLLDRFRSDATTLRLRATAQKNAARPLAGPNAALSAAMADACEQVVALAEQLPQNATVDVMIGALQELVPKLTTMANAPEVAASPALRSVYLGACTRAQELIAAETTALRTNRFNGTADDDDESSGDDVVEDDEEDFADIDDELGDDEIDDDDLYDEHRGEDRK